MENNIFYIERKPWAVNYVKADLSSPVKVNDGEGDFLTYPSCVISLTKDRIYYDEGNGIDDNVEGALDSFRLEEIDKSKDCQRIREEDFEKMKDIALDWIRRYEDVMRLHGEIKNNFG